MAAEREEAARGLTPLRLGGDWARSNSERTSVNAVDVIATLPSGISAIIVECSESESGDPLQVMAHGFASTASHVCIRLFSGHARTWR